MSLPAGDGESYPTGDGRCPPRVNPGTSEISSDPGTLGKLRSPPASPTSDARPRSRSGTAGGLHSGTIEVLDQRLAPTDFEWDRGGSWGGANVATWVLQGLPEPDFGTTRTTLFNAPTSRRSSGRYRALKPRGCVRDNRQILLGRFAIRGQRRDASSAHRRQGIDPLDGQVQGRRASPRDLRTEADRRGDLRRVTHVNTANRGGDVLGVGDLAGSPELGAVGARGFTLERGALLAG